MDKENYIIDRYTFTLQNILLIHEAFTQDDIDEINLHYKIFY